MIKMGTVSSERRKSLNNVLGLPLTARLAEHDENPSLGTNIVGMLELAPYMILFSNFMATLNGARIDTQAYLTIISAFIIKTIVEHKLQKITISASDH